MSKIEKIVKPKLETPEARRARLEALLKKSEELQAKAETLQAKLEKLAPAPKPAVAVQAVAGGPTDLIACGKEVIDFHEGINCQKIGVMVSYIKHDHYPHTTVNSSSTKAPTTKN